MRYVITHTHSHTHERWPESLTPSSWNFEHKQNRAHHKILSFFFSFPPPPTLTLFSDSATTDRLLFSGLVCNRGYSQLWFGSVAVAITALLCLMLMAMVSVVIFITRVHGSSLFILHHGYVHNRMLPYYTSSTLFSMHSKQNVSKMSLCIEYLFNNLLHLQRAI